LLSKEDDMAIVAVIVGAAVLTWGLWTTRSTGRELGDSRFIDLKQGRDGVWRM
jgi:hypothetical protein